MPTLTTVFTALTTARILELCRLFGCNVGTDGAVTGSKDRLIAKLEGLVHLGLVMAAPIEGW